MKAVGIDVSKGHSTVSVVDERKRVEVKPFTIHHTKTDFAELISFLNRLPDDTRVIMEHTGVYYRCVAETLSNAGFYVSVVNPVLINQYGNNTLRQVKTDRKDAKKIAKYAIDNWDELREFSPSGALRETLKTTARQFALCQKTLASHKNSLIALLEKVFPGANTFFTSITRPDGRQKWVDFLKEFWHNDCVASLSEKKFAEKYAKFCKKNGYVCRAGDSRAIHAQSLENIAVMPKDDMTKMIVLTAVNQIISTSKNVERLRAQMINIAKRLPEFPCVSGLYGVGETLAALLIAEIGDINRFHNKHSLVAFAGVDPDKNDSGKHVSVSGSISRSGNALLRKAAYQVAECHLKNAPHDEPVFQFLDKKRREGKHFYVYMTAACNKFLRIYYGRVKEYLQSLQSCSLASEPEAKAENLADSATAAQPTLALDKGDSSRYTAVPDGDGIAISCSPSPSPSAKNRKRDESFLSRVAAG